ncbi:hypothetical protein [Thermosipho sp. (in: thermotogales)]|jgi:hypothetical protein|uniref:hypothetical protein n=1 Tax=Thermosipho sp. (in: thermotogales) TaxID=1968895 RepID=UPI00257FE9F3|nr:hypothetical protein [Thermosipho sp. (in: thermotogales)]MBZ4649231.1 hypothetical protein [Thermosipho sp. (in: thermotogales)]
MTERNLEELLSIMEEKRKISVNYNEFQTLSEFLILHNQSFTVKVSENTDIIDVILN